jgi:hypothetical protein
MWFNYTKKASNCNEATKFIIAEAHMQRWRQQKQKLLNLNSTRKTFL